MEWNGPRHRKARKASICITAHPEVVFANRLVWDQI